MIEEYKKYKFDGGYSVVMNRWWIRIDTSYEKNWIQQCFFMKKKEIVELYRLLKANLESMGITE